ncbi:hypothetical protein [Christiangramia sp.]|uniref:hypothetical protein n=1 Tax=Christiangramia sp. TaxID=1931228 RepID=UPI0026146A54|nr:hypothetical protein [Christiangramia sp.]
MPDIITQGKRKARKEHICDWCNSKILIGELYNHAVLKYDDIYTWKNHIECMKIAQELDMFSETGSEGLDADSFNDFVNYEFSNHIDSIPDAVDRKYSLKEKVDFLLDNILSY